MKILRKHHREYDDLAKTTPSGTKKISVILPARNEHQTIGRYLPEFAELMEAGFIHEIILADSSDDGRTINEFLSSAIKTEPFASMIALAKEKGLPLPVKAVSVFDPRFEKLFGKKTVEPGKAPGKGRTMYVGMAVATGDHFIFLDSDFFNIHPRFLNGLIGPIEKEDAQLVKATFELEDEWQTVIDFCNEEGRVIPTCDTLLNSCVSRNLARPLMQLLNDIGTHPGVNEFEGPISGGYGASADIWKNMRIPTRYGIEVYSLMQISNLLDEAALAIDVNLGIVDQTSTELEGKKMIGKNIIGAYFRALKEDFPETFSQIVKNPRIFKLNFTKVASLNSVHVDDVEQVRLYGDLIEERLVDTSILNKTLILPELNANSYYSENKFLIHSMANDFTVERVNILLDSFKENESFVKPSVESSISF
ncbi:hypothetical protein JXA48_02735 [Candidatus Woesearchaeota archaeon]|nr:hypothetical protein [Candidatus Woesearchaeota archaeon]